MNKRLKEKWVKALRSGKIKQLRRDWSNGTSYCCLGLLLAIKDGVVGSQVRGDRFRCTALLGNDNAAVQTLIDMNDGAEGRKAHSFKEIATYVEQRL